MCVHVSDKERDREVHSASIFLESVADVNILTIETAGLVKVSLLLSMKLCDLTKRARVSLKLM